MNNFVSSQFRIPLVLGAGMLLWLAAIPLLAATPEGEQVNWLHMGMGLFGGLALFLFGMEQMADALKAVAGERMKDILAKLTTNRVTAALSGAFVTAVIQSSSVTTVLVVGFISAGLMTMPQSIGIIMGANVGTTITAQIVAFKVEEAALLMIAVGFAMLFTGKRDKVRQYGGMIMGLGLVFFGMGVMSDAMSPLRTYEPFLDLMRNMDNPLLGILVAAIFTALVQSSSATTGIVIVMASQGFISLPAGIALALGANVGTCITAILAAIGKPREAARAASVHVMFNVIGVLIWIWLIPVLAAIAVWMSPSHLELEGTARLAAEAPRQIANANTFFNIANTLFFLPFVNVLANLAMRLLPDKPVEEKVIIQPKFLDDVLIQTPTLALERVRFELGHMGELVQAMLSKTREAFDKRERGLFEEVIKMDDQTDILNGHIARYVGDIGKGSLSDVEKSELFSLMQAGYNLENISDVIEKDFVRLGLNNIEKNIEASETLHHMFEGLVDTVTEALDASVRALAQNDQRAAQDVMTMDDKVNNLTQDVIEYQAGQALIADPERLPIIRMEMEALEKLKRVYGLSKRIARTVLPEELKEIA